MSKSRFELRGWAKATLGVAGALVAFAPAAYSQQRPAQTPAMPPGMVMPAAPTGGNAANPEGLPEDNLDPKAMQERMKLLEQRVRDLESSTVLSDPETRVKKKEVYVDKNGNLHDTPVDGAKKTVTYERERVYRRQTINEKIEEAMADAAKHSVEVGVDASIIAQFARRTVGPATIADNHAYELASADLFFTAGVAQNTMFFADIVGVSGPPPDLEIGSATLLNGYAARLFTPTSGQNLINVREAWLRTELFGQRLAVTAGRLDLTNYFDSNAAANDETTQFISDALVNNQMLGLSENGAGVALVFDPKKGINFKIGMQQSSSAATSLSQAMFSLAEVGYVARPVGLEEGNYRVWYRANNNGAGGYMTAYGVSIDQRIVPEVTFFARYGSAQQVVHRDHFYSGGLQFSNGAGLFPGDVWGIGYAQTDYQPITGMNRQRLVEGYYNFQLTEKLRLSFHATHALDLIPGSPNQGFLVPGVRLQASF